MSGVSLEGELVLVTGGGQGLGAATCGVLARAGAAVAVTDLHADRAETVAREICANGGKAFALRLDVGDERTAPEALEAAAEAHGGLFALINNAGVDFTKPIDELTIEQWDTVVRTNLRGPFLLCRAAAAVMKRHKRGHIVNVASTAAKRAWANASAYHASKWGLLGLSYALHAELRPHGVRVCAVVAGGMRTPFLLDRFPDLDPSKLQDPENVAETIKHVLTQPPGTAIAEVMVIPTEETSWP
ncbi:MAG TPA: SDR family oxidoreductase [Gammaproteobacteria bacterium]|nr:SDR family oxidoreductase [Gammaproteobacteria bacterium]